MIRKLFFFSFVFYCLLCTSPNVLQAYYCPLEIFTNNGSYNDSDNLHFFTIVSDPGAGLVDFTFHNESFYNEIPVESSIARIYFQDGSLLNFAGITDGPGTSFNQSARPRNLPSGKSLAPPFITTPELSFNSGPPRPHNGINPGEWVRITFGINGGTFADVIEKLNTGAMRIGAHIIAFPDGSSESAIAVPEPATISLLGLGILLLLKKRRA